jgi:adenylate cyclase
VAQRRQTRGGRCGRPEQSLKNSPRPLRVYRIGPSLATEQPTTQPTALPLPDKPSIAVLPFANMSGDPEQEHFVDGMVEEIITALKYTVGSGGLQ